MRDHRESAGGECYRILSLLLSGRIELSFTYHLALPDNVIAQTLALLPLRPDLAIPSATLRIEQARCTTFLIN